jgi:hypothetical protein
MYSVEIGQNWSIWDSGRRQWLLGQVIRRVDGRAILRYDARYQITIGHDERSADESTMLTATNLFRRVA